MSKQQLKTGQKRSLVPDCDWLGSLDHYYIKSSSDVDQKSEILDL